MVGTEVAAFASAALGVTQSSEVGVNAWVDRKGDPHVMPYHYLVLGLLLYSNNYDKDEEEDDCSRQDVSWCVQLARKLAVSSAILDWRFGIDVESPNAVAGMYLAPSTRWTCATRYTPSAEVSLLPKDLALVGELPPRQDFADPAEMKEYFRGAIEAEQWDLCSLAVKHCTFPLSELAKREQYIAPLVASLGVDSTTGISLQRWIKLLGIDVLLDSCESPTEILGSVHFPLFAEVYDVLQRRGLEPSTTEWELDTHFFSRYALESALAYGRQSVQKSIEYTSFCLGKGNANEIHAFNQEPGNWPPHSPHGGLAPHGIGKHYVPVKLLEYALQFSVPALVRFLLEYFPGVEKQAIPEHLVRSAVAGGAANTALVVGLLPDWVVNISFRDISGHHHWPMQVESLQWLLENKDLSEWFWDSVLRYAAKFSELDVLRFVLTEPRIAVTPSESVIQATFEGSCRNDVLRFLISEGVDIPAIVESIEGWEPRCDCIDDLKLLVEVCGLDPNAMNQQGENLLMKQVRNWWRDWEAPQSCFLCQTDRETLEYSVGNLKVNIYCPINDKWSIFSMLVIQNQLGFLTDYVELQPIPASFKDQPQEYGSIFHLAARTASLSMLRFVCDRVGHAAARAVSTLGESADTGNAFDERQLRENLFYCALEASVVSREGVELLRYLIEEVQLPCADDYKQLDAMLKLTVSRSNAFPKEVKQYLDEHLETIKEQQNQ